MDYNWLVPKFWVEILGVIVSLVAAIATAVTSAPNERPEKVATAIIVAGIFAAIIRSKYDVLKELKEYKSIAENTGDALELYTKVTRAIGEIETANLRQRAELEKEHAFHNILELAKGRVVLGAYESMLYQATIVRSAKEKVFAIHTVKDERDLSKWLKHEGEFSELMQAYIDMKPVLKTNAMVRVFVVAKELVEKREVMDSLKKVKELSERTYGFKSSIVLRTMASLEAQIIPSLLQVDNSGLVVVQFESSRDGVRDYKVVAYEGKGLEAMLASDAFSTWTALQRAADMSSVCFADADAV